MVSLNERWHKATAVEATAVRRSTVLNNVVEVRNFTTRMREPSVHPLGVETFITSVSEMANSACLIMTCDSGGDQFGRPRSLSCFPVAPSTLSRTSGPEAPDVSCQPRAGPVDNGGPVIHSGRGRSSF
jgi:ureidoglycolate hydrolase